MEQVGEGMRYYLRFGPTVELGKAICSFWLVICLAATITQRGQKLLWTFRSFGMIEQVCRGGG